MKRLLSVLLIALLCSTFAYGARVQVSGTPSEVKTISGTITALSFANPLSVDMDSGTILTLTVTGDTTLNATNGRNGQWVFFLLTDDGAGGHTVTFGTNFLSEGSITTVASDTHSILFAYDGTNWHEQARSPISAAGITLNKDIVASGTGMSGGQDDVLPGADSDVTITLTTAKDIVAGTGLTGGEDDVLPGADADVTISLDSSASPTLAGLTLSGLTASRIVQTTAGKALASIADLTSWIAGTANYLTVTDDLDGTVTLATVNNGDVVAGGGLTGGADNVLPGADLDTTLAIGAGDGVIVNADEIEVSGLVASDGSPNDALTTDAAGKVTAGYSMDVTGTMAATTVTGANVTSGADPGHTHTGGSLTLTLDQVGDPAANKTFTMGSNLLTFRNSNPAGGILFDLTGAGSSHYFEVNQNTGNPGAGTHLVHIEADDSDVLLLHLDFDGDVASQQLAKYQLDAATTADNDEIYFSFYLDQDGTVTSQDELEFARFTTVATDVTEDSEDAIFTIDLVTGGSFAEAFRLDGSGVAYVNDGTNQMALPGVKRLMVFNLHDPDDTMDNVKIAFERAVTITKVIMKCDGGTNVIGRLYEVDGDGDPSDQVGIEASDWTVTTTETEDTSFNNASLDAGDYLSWDTTSVSGSVINFNCTVYGFEQ